MRGDRVLEGVGLDEAAEAAYRLLLRHPSLSLRELSDELGIGLGAARRCAEELVRVGLATGDGGSPPRYTPVDPRLAIPALVRERQAGLARASATVASFAADFHERMLRTEPHRLVEVLEGPSAINARVAALLGTAEQEVLAFDAPPYVAVDPTAEPAEVQLLERGVRVRALYASEALSVPGKVDSIEQLTGLGEIARVVAHVPLKMVMIDRRAAIVPLTAGEESTRTTAVIVGQSRLCDALVELFEATWVQGSPVFAPPTEGVADVDDADRQLLGMLGGGMKDEAIARHLGVSERTVRRHIADLMVRLGVTGRFQAGAQAVRRGWI